jgi:hypothetical protein
MRRQTPALAAIALAALALDGCGEDPGIQQGTVPFQGTNTAPLDPLTSQMKKKMQDKSYVNKSEEGDKPAGESKPTTESRPAADSKPAADSRPEGDSAKPAAGPRPATESKPAAESGPTTEAKPATKGG